MSENLATLSQVKNTGNQIQDDVEHQTSATRAPHSDRMSLLDGSGSGCDDIPTKKKKTRRGKPKRRNVHPYVRFSWQHRKNLDEIQTNKANKTRAKMIAHGQALAPYNTTQFLIEDHGYMKDIEERLTDKSEHPNNRTGPPRTRDSSFSVDSDVDFYSSPEDEEEFLTKEFSNTYQDIRSERLNTMTREQLMQECIQMENKVDMLTKCLSGKSTNIGEKKETNNINNELDENGVFLNMRTIKDFQVEMVKLMNENDTLRRENEHLRQRRRHRKVGSISSSMSSSIDSESDSASSSSSSSDTEVENTSNTLVTPAADSTDYAKNEVTHSAPPSPFASPKSPIVEREDQQEIGDSIPNHALKVD